MLQLMVFVLSLAVFVFTPLEQGSGLDPLGLTTPSLQDASTGDAGAGYDPNGAKSGLNPSTPAAPTGDYGAGFDPNG